MQVTNFFTGKRKRDGSSHTYYTYENGKLISKSFSDGLRCSHHTYVNGEQIRDIYNLKNTCEYRNGKIVSIKNSTGEKIKKYPVKKQIDFDLKSYVPTPFCLINGIINGTEIISSSDLVHHINWKNEVKEGQELLYKVNRDNNNKMIESKLIGVKHWNDGLREDYEY